MLRVLNKTTHDVKRFLFLNKGIVMPFSKLGVHPQLNMEMERVHKCLKTLKSQNYIEKLGNWQHAWFFVTEEGYKMLKEEVGRPNEEKKEESQDIKH